MAAQIRPNAKLMKAAFKILKTPKTLQQKWDKHPTAKRRYEWNVDQNTSA